MFKIESIAIKLIYGFWGYFYELKTCKYIFEGKNKEEEIHNRYNGIIKKTEYYDYINSKLIIVETNLRISLF